MMPLAYRQPFAAEGQEHVGRGTLRYVRLKGKAILASFHLIYMPFHSHLSLGSFQRALAPRQVTHRMRGYRYLLSMSLDA